MSDSKPDRAAADDDLARADGPAAVDGPTAPARRALMLGAVGAASVLSIRPALAQTAGSVLQCDIPVPDARGGSSFIAANGALVPPGTKGAFPPLGRPVTGEEAKRALANGSLPGYGYDQGQAYLNYIRRLQRGQAGFTCFASVQMLRR